MVPELLGHRLRIPGLWQDQNGTRSLLTNTCSRMANRESRPASHHLSPWPSENSWALSSSLPSSTNPSPSFTDSTKWCRLPVYPLSTCTSQPPNLPSPLYLSLKIKSERPREFPSIAAYCKQPKSGGVEGLGTRLVQQQVMKVLGLSWNQKLKTT